jgi:ABC-type amino acid transport substrate-binding protein
MSHNKQFRYYFLLFFLLGALAAGSQSPWRADSWQTVLENRKGTVTALWYDIEPFIYLNKDGQLEGVEYEIMESLKPYLKHKYGIDLKIDWINAQSFENIYEGVKLTEQLGVFGWSYYSITAERKKEVQFTLPYMPDVNVIVTNNNEPLYETAEALTAKLRGMRGYTMANTTMEQDIHLLKKAFYPALSITKSDNDYTVMQNIADDPTGFGYVPLSVYIVGLQKGIKVKRQHILSSRREGFAAVMPPDSDWKKVMDEYFKTAFFLSKANDVAIKYLGREVKDLVIPGTDDSLVSRIPDMQLVTLEKEIVTKRLMDTSLEMQRQKSFRNTILIILLFLVLLAAILYSRFRTKQKMSEKLEQRNQLISKQNEQIEQMNQMLKLKVLQARMNPHFLFNSLNSIQYFITADNKTASMQYISRFSAFLRKVINFGDELSITIHDEAELLNEYLWLEHSRFPGKFDYEIHLPVDGGHERILPLLTHSLVETALYKGVLNLQAGRKGRIVIDFNAGNNLLYVKVTDNGMSRDLSTELEKRKGLSDRQEDMLAKRVNLFNRQGKRKIHLRFEATGEAEFEMVNEAVLEIPQPLFD